MTKISINLGYFIQRDQIWARINDVQKLQMRDFKTVTQILTFLSRESWKE